MFKIKEICKNGYTVLVKFNLCVFGHRYFVVEEFFYKMKDERIVAGQGGEIGALLFKQC